jgi:uncharacterized protein YhbP (UPF0306 family)
LTVVYNVQFKPVFAGTRTIWTNAYSVSSGFGSLFQSYVGGANLSWTVPGAAVVPTLVSFSPGSGSGSARAFTAVYGSTAGGGDILATQVLMSGTGAWANSCFFGYDKFSNSFLLLNDAGTAWLGGIPPGSGSVSNNQCTILGAGSSATVLGNQLTVVYNVQFKPVFAGTRRIWTNAYSVSSGLGSPFQSYVGGANLSWTVPGAAVVPTLVSFSPGSGSGSAQAFTAVYGSTAGGGDILATQVVVSGTGTWANGCFFGYDKFSNSFLLLNDAGTAWLGGIPPGSGSVANSQCTISGAGSSATVLGNQLTVVYNVQFKPAFAGTKTIWTNAYSVSSGLGSPFQSNVGGANLSWTVN